MTAKYGFTIEKEERIDEIKSDATLYKHSTGARLIHLKNEDNNKVFTIGFRTPPPNDKGIPHIVEHCVLSGSRKYKTKEPFMDLSKGSMQTFLNAMTFPDMTIYPVASRNDKDFKNLTDVYLDAVFFPAIYENEKIFMQEAWHREIFNEEDPIKYVGVVYNEMRGAYSTPEALLYLGTQRAQFPDTIYVNDYAGDPYAIPDLTYEEFQNFHKRYYHPSNSYMFLYGDMDIDKYLEHIDKDYLSHFKYQDPKSKIKPQNPFTERRYMEQFYNITEDDSTENKDYFILNYTFGEVGNLEDYYTIALLSEILIDSDAAIIKNAILENELAEDVMVFDFQYAQNKFSIIAKNAKHENKDKFIKLIEDTLKDTVKNGIDKKLLEASINKLEFDLSEGGSFPTKGIIYYQKMMDFWLHDHEPFSPLKYKDTIKLLRDKLHTDYYEKYIEKNFINNNFQSFLNLRPKKNFSLKRDKKVEEDLQQFKENLSKEELEKLIEDNKALSKMQLEEDSKEKKDTIPKLSLDEIEKDGGIIDYEVIDKDIKTVYKEGLTNGVIYFRQAFDLSVLTLDELKYVPILSEILGGVDTEQYDYKELSNEIYLNTGGISFGTSITEGYKTGDIKAYFSVSSKLMSDKADKVHPLIKEIVFRSKFDSKKRIKEIIQILKSRFEMDIFDSGNMYSSLRALSYVSKQARIQEITDGLEFFEFLQGLEKNFDKEFEILSKKLEEICKKIFQKENSISMVTSERVNLEKILAPMTKFVEGLPVGKTGVMEDVKLEVKNEGIKSAANVQYVSKATNLSNMGIEVIGVDSVISRLLNSGYLHNNIRAKGGAYGAGIRVSMNGKLSTFSYRDPNLVETLKVYDGMGAFLKDIEIDNSELESLIIGTMNGLNPPLTERGKGEVAFARYIQGIDNEDIIKYNEEALNTTIESIKDRAEVYSKAMEQDVFAVLGNDKKIEENKEIFGSTKNLMI